MHGMRQGAHSLLLVGFVLLLGSCGSNDLEIEGTEDFEAYLRDERSDQNIPALSVLIFESDQILYEGYFGQADVANRVPLTRDHVFLLASVSKVVTATALLQLYEKGHFVLDDPINDYLPFPVKHPRHAEDITFRMLLTHTSSIADGDALDSQYYYGQDSPVELVDFFQNYLVLGGTFYDPTDNYHDFRPGSVFEYSNSGNALIGVLVEEIADMSFNAYCKQHIFAPLEMHHTFWRLDEVAQPIVQPYDFSDGEYEAIEHYTFTDYPNGGLRSTGQDLFKLLRAFASHGAASGFHVLKAETIADMMTPQIPNLDPSMGLHLFLLDADHNLWGHDGGEQGVATIMGFNPENGVGAILLSNQGEANLDAMLIQAYQLGLKLQRGS